MKLKNKNNLKTDIVDGFCKSCDVFEPPPLPQVGVLPLLGVRMGWLRQIESQQVFDTKNGFKYFLLLKYFESI